MNQEKQFYPRVIAGAFIFNEKDELLLLKSEKWGNKFLNPGGGVKLGETSEKALRREIKDETGIVLDELTFLEAGEYIDKNLLNKDKSGHIAFFHYKAEVKGIKKIKLNNESTDYKWQKVTDWINDKEILPAIKIRIEKYFINKESYKNKYLRALADYQNLLKRSAEEKQEFAKYANEQFLMEVLPVYDNLRVALDHADETVKENGWAKGIEYVIKQFKDFLEAQGIEEIETKGKKFDPQTMEAMKGKGEKVKKELKPGYKLKGKVIVAGKVELE